MESRITGADLWRPGRLATILALAAMGFAANGLSNVANAAMISASYSHTCAVSEGGGVKCWGSNSVFGLGDGTLNSRVSPVDVAGLGTRISDVSVGTFYTCALTTAGVVKCWGDNRDGQLGEGVSGSWSATPVDVMGLSPGVSAIATGSGHTCALTATGGVRCWGSNEYGALGDGSGANSRIPVDVVGLTTGVIAIQAGNKYSCALMTGGAVKCWGANWYGQLGDGTYTNRATPVDVDGLSTGVTAIASGLGHTCAVADQGRVKCWGQNYGSFGNGTWASSPTPMDATSLLVPATAVVVGGLHTCALLIDGTVSCWGMNTYGALGDGTTTTSSTARQVSGLASPVTELAAAEGLTCARLSSGELKCWGDGEWGKLGNGVTIRRLTAVQVSGLPGLATSISTASYHACALTSAGGVECWGMNNSGELGLGTTLPHSTPAPVQSLDSAIKSVAVEHSYSCAVTLGSEAFCWGSNRSGQLGDGTHIDRLLPVAVSNLGANVDMLASGFDHNCALTNDGGVQCWGQNYNGQLGDGTEDGHEVPGQVTGLTTGISSIAAADYHTCALSDGGGIKCWGQNASGQLGDGTTTNRLVPVSVVGLDSGVIAIAAGQSLTCALLESGSVKCWGRGQLVPFDIAGLGGAATAISVGFLHACAVVNGVAKCWGGNWYGQLGDGTGIERQVPVDVVGLDANVVSISAGVESTCAVTESGTAWCWGSNLRGQLGNGEAGFSLFPQTVVGTPFGIFRNGFE